MYKKLRYTIEYYTKLIESMTYALSDEDAKGKKEIRKSAKKELKRLYTHITFYQHERLVHLIVMTLFALAVVISVPFDLMLLEPAMIALSALLLILLIPYIVHYYHLENGTQHLYELYKALEVIADPAYKDLRIKKDI